MKKTEDYLAESDMRKASPPPMAPSRQEYNQNVSDIDVNVEYVQPNELKITTTDPTVLSIIKQLDERSKVGLETYGVSLREDDTRDFGQWITELQQELMDATNYLEKVKELWKTNQK